MYIRRVKNLLTQKAVIKDRIQSQAKRLSESTDEPSIQQMIENLSEYSRKLFAEGYEEKAV